MNKITGILLREKEGIRSTGCFFEASDNCRGAAAYDWRSLAPRMPLPPLLYILKPVWTRPSPGFSLIVSRTVLFLRLPYTSLKYKLLLCSFLSLTPSFC